MLTIITDLKPFLEDNYRRINVREYARLLKISPPTASKTLDGYHKSNLLNRIKDQLSIFYFANRDNKTFIDLSRIYWRERLEKIGFLEVIKKGFTISLVILFGSCAKGEVSPQSDIDIVIITPIKKEINLKDFEKQLNRKIQIFFFRSKEEIKNKELLNNILNGYILEGSW